MQAHDLLKRPKIQHAIARAQQKLLARRELSAARVLEETRRIAFAQVPECFDGRGHLRPMTDWPEDLRSSVSSLEFDGETGRLKRLRAWSKVQALELLARHFGLVHRPEDQPVRTEAAGPAIVVLVKGDVQLPGAPAPVLLESTVTDQTEAPEAPGGNGHQGLPRVVLTLGKGAKQL